MAVIRLDKYLADMQLGTRSQVKSLIKAKRVKVNGQLVKKADVKIETSEDEVLVDNQVIAYESYEYYILNKPQGVVSATVDNHYKTVVDLITVKKRKDLFPVGRLDIDTEGLLLITNDGELCHNMLAPNKHVAKCYFAIVLGEVPEEAKVQFLEGIDIGTSEEEITLPAQLQIKQYQAIKDLDTELKEKVLASIVQGKEKPCKSDSFEESTVTLVELTIHQGKFHQVKRMFQAIQCPVLYLKRLSMGSLLLPEDLKVGEYRRLRREEVEMLQEKK